MMRTVFLFTNTLLKGVSQIMLQEKAATGILFLAGIFYGSINMGIAALLSVLCGTMIAKILKFDKTEIEKGLYGFSPALTGVALILFFKPDIYVWIVVVMGSVAAAIVQHLFLRKKIPVFTLPFVLVTWTILYLSHLFSVLSPVPAEPMIASVFDALFAFRGYGQVIFQSSAASGILFFLGVLLCSSSAALFGLIASFLGGYIALWLGEPSDAVSLGLFSFNAVLSAIAFAAWKWKSAMWSAIAAVLSVLISIVMNHFDWIQLTFPFVAATCICLFLKKYLEGYYQKANNQ